MFVPVCVDVCKRSRGACAHVLIFVHVLTIFFDDRGNTFLHIVISYVCFFFVVVVSRVPLMITLPVWPAR